MKGLLKKLLVILPIAIALVKALHDVLPDSEQKQEELKTGE